MKTLIRALIALALCAGLAAALSGCGRDACTGHGGVHVGPVKGWYYCNDGTTQPWPA